ncbi:MAG: BatA domain-containing protein, partial [Puniceicoccales bacterium]
MQFLSPLYLWGALAIAAPILIHLIKHRKVQVVPWAAHRFLVQAVKRLQKRKRLNEILLLIMRCLLFLLLALLFARPFFPGDETAAATSSEPTMLLIDVSASMGYSDGLRSRLEQAVDHAEQTLSSVGSNAPVGLVLFSDRATPVVSPPTDDHAVVHSELSRVMVTPSGSNLEAGLSAALSGLESLGGGRI